MSTIISFCPWVVNIFMTQLKFDWVPSCRDKRGEQRNKIGVNGTPLCYTGVPRNVALVSECAHQPCASAQAPFNVCSLIFILFRHVKNRV